MKEPLKNVLNNAEMVLISRAEYDALKIQNELLTEQLRLLNKKVFGASSEKTSQQSHACMDGQMTFPFNEAEVCADAPKAEPEKTTVAAHTRKSTLVVWKEICRMICRLKLWSTVWLMTSFPARNVGRK